MLGRAMVPPVWAAAALVPALAQLARGLVPRPAWAPLLLGSAAGFDWARLRDLGREESIDTTGD